MKNKILSIGSINMDVCLRFPHFPNRGESVVGSEYQIIPGGKGANQAVAIALQGGDVTFVSKVGQDAYGRELRKQMQDKGIHTENLNVDPTAPSGFAAVMIDDSGENRILVYPGAAMHITAQELKDAFQKDYDAVVVQFETAQDIVIEACRLACAKKIPVIVDAGPALDFPIEELEGVEIFSPNETEAALMCKFPITDEASAERAAKLLMERTNARYIVLKLGSKGAMLYDGAVCESFSVPAVQKVDPTAAGDVFTGALAVEYLQHGDIRKAIRYANLAGTLTVTKLGAQTSIPTREEVERFVENAHLDPVYLP